MNDVTAACGTNVAPLLDNDCSTFWESGDTVDDYCSIQIIIPAGMDWTTLEVFTGYHGFHSPHSCTVKFADKFEKKFLLHSVSAFQWTTVVTKAEIKNEVGQINIQKLQLDLYVSPIGQKLPHVRLQNIRLLGAMKGSRIRLICLMVCFIVLLGVDVSVVLFIHNEVYFLSGIILQTIIYLGLYVFECM